MDKHLPPGVPRVYRGGSSMKFRPHEVKTDRLTGLLKPSHGVSVDAEPGQVERFGGAYEVVSIPQGLEIIQRGQREAHYEIVPASPMMPAEYQSLLDQVALKERRS